MLQTRPRTGVYKSDVVEPKAHQNDRNYVSSVDLLSKFTMQGFTMEGSYMEDLQKPQNCQNWGVSACPGQYGSTTTLGCTLLCHAKPSLKAEWYMSVMRMLTLFSYSTYRTEQCYHDHPTDV